MPIADPLTVGMRRVARNDFARLLVATQHFLYPR
jgi:hypothetical protein